MPLEVISSETAWNSAYRNKYAKYPTPRSGAQRLYPIPHPEAKATFRIDREATIFSMGSCFAREVDVALIKSGFKIISRNTPLSKAVTRDVTDQRLFNKYTVQSILNEVRWALDPTQPYPGEAALVQTGEDQWMDLQTGGENVEGSLANMLHFRASYCESMRSLTKADVVIITLGMVESWYDTTSGLHLNVPPPLEVCERWPGRFELHIHQYAEVLQALEEVRALIVRHGKPGVRFLVTVDPIPQRLTFREDDVLLTNTYGKSVQRAAVEALVAAHDDVDYFPSYECVALGDPSSTFTREDFRHLPQVAVERIVGKVIANYCVAEKLDPKVAAKEISKLAQEKKHAKIAEMARAVEWEALDSKTLYFLGTACKQVGEFETAYGIFAKLVQRPEVQKNVLENALITARLARKNEVIPGLLAKHAELFPEGAAFRAGFDPKSAKSVGRRVLEHAGKLVLLVVGIPMMVAAFFALIGAGIMGLGARTRTGIHALDCFFNATLFNGLAYESIPSHAWRDRHLRWARLVIAATDLISRGYSERCYRREQPFVDLALSKGMQRR